jgi:hypothetical protein
MCLAPCQPPEHKVRHRDFDEGLARLDSALIVLLDIWPASGGESTRRNFVQRSSGEAGGGIDAYPVRAPRPPASSPCRAAGTTPPTPCRGRSHTRHAPSSSSGVARSTPVHGRSWRPRWGGRTRRLAGPEYLNRSCARDSGVLPNTWRPNTWRPAQYVASKYLASGRHPCRLRSATGCLQSRRGCTCVEPMRLPARHSLHHSPITALSQPPGSSAAASQRRAGNAFSPMPCAPTRPWFALLIALLLLTACTGMGSGGSGSPGPPASGAQPAQPGATPVTLLVRSASIPVPSSTTSSQVTVACRPGEQMLGGGFAASHTFEYDAMITDTYPSSATGWTVTAASSPAFTLCVQATVCLQLRRLGSRSLTPPSLLRAAWPARWAPCCSAAASRALP